MASRNYVFTLNNPTISEKRLLHAFKKEAKSIRYVVFQKEKAETGTVHYQGYVEMSTPHTMVWMHKHINKRLSFQKRRGTRVQARDYCMKSDTRIEGPWEYGDWKAGGSGSRTDISELYKDSRSDMTILDVADKHQGTYLKYWKAVRHVKQLCAVDKPPIRMNLKVILYYGPPGTGKTRRAYAYDPNLFAVPIGKDIWYDNYRGESTVLLDDFAGEMRLSDLLRLLDIYPIQVPVKGDFVWMKATTIIITTNKDPINWYNYQQRQDSWEALMRRIHECVDFSDLKDCSIKETKFLPDLGGEDSYTATTQELDVVFPTPTQHQPLIDLADTVINLCSSDSESTDLMSDDDTNDELMFSDV